MSSATGTWNSRKAVLQSDAAGAAAKRGTRHTLISTLEVLLRALHPLAPFISEEIWQRVRVERGRRRATPSCAARIPKRGIGCTADPGAEPEMRWVIDFIEGVRQIRGELDIAPSRKLEVLLQNAGPQDVEYLGRNLHYLMRLAGIEAPRVLAPARGRADFRRRTARNAGDIGSHGRPDRPRRRTRRAWPSGMRKAEVDLTKIGRPS